MKRPDFPFTAVVGQEPLKLALLLAVIDPRIGGGLHIQVTVKKRRPLSRTHVQNAGPNGIPDNMQVS